MAQRPGGPPRVPDSGSGPAGVGPAGDRTGGEQLPGSVARGAWPAVPAGAAPTPGPDDVRLRGALGEGGSALWDLLQSFVDARSAFRRIYRRYERRVLAAARQRDVPREHLLLPPEELWRLFDLADLERLRDGALVPLRRQAEAVFGERGDDGLLDTFCAHAYHEVAILCAEHRAVGRFVRIHDPERYRELFAEVSGYYPRRLRRLRRFFDQGLKRLEELLPLWARHRVVVRSAYLFGAALAAAAWQGGLEGLYARMHPGEGLPKGLLEAARSFHAAGFDERAREALALAVAACGAPGGGAGGAVPAALAAEVRAFASALEAQAALPPGAGAPECAP